MSKKILKTAKNKTKGFFSLLVESITYKVVIFAIFAVYLVYSFAVYRSSIQSQINKNTKAHLSEIVNESLEKVHIKINDEFIVAHTMTGFYGEDIELSITEKLLKDAMEKHPFEGILILDKDKQSVLSVGNVSTFEDDTFIDKAMDGKDSISKIYSMNDAEYISLAVPIFSQETQEVSNIMICTYGIQELTGILDTSTFEQIGTTFTLDINNTTSIQKLKKYLKNGSSGILTYGKSSKKIYVCYNVIPDTEWYSVSVVSASAIEPIVKRLSNLSYNYAVQLGIVIVIYMMIILGIDMNVLRKKKLENLQ